MANGKKNGNGDKPAAAEKKPQYGMLVVQHGRMVPKIIGRTEDFAQLKKDAYYAIKDGRADQVIIIKIIGRYLDKSKTPKVVWEEISPKREKKPGNGG